MLDVQPSLTENSANIRGLLVPKWIAVNLDALGAQSITDTFLEAEAVTCSWLPPAALVPRFRGEPIRGDVTFPPHVRGTGFPWPPEAGVDQKNGCGRWPIAYVWEALAKASPWAWRAAKQDVELSPAEAIGAALSAVLLQHTREPRIRPRTILVVPNDLPEAAQQDLLDHCQALGLDTKLLWRPIAAALVWLNRFEEELKALWHEELQSLKLREVFLGRLLAVHMGAEAAEATALSVVARRVGKGWRILAGRHRPDRNCSAHGAGQRPLERLVSLILAGQSRAPSLANQWNLHWASDVLPRTLENLRRAPVGSGGSHGLWLQACSSTSVPGADGRLGQFSRPAPSPKGPRRSALDALREAKKQLGSDRLLGVILTGPLAATFIGSETLAAHHLGKARIESDRILIEGDNLPLGALALGAGRFADLILSNKPAYLDTLPQVQLAVAVQGEPTWKSLLLEDQHWVEGGMVWKRTPNFLNLEIRAASKTLDINLVHEEFTTVRMVRSEIPVTLEQTAAISLAVSMEPAQGSARVEIVPDEEGLFGRRRVWVEWRRMTDTGQSPDTYLQENYPRLFPPLLPRMASLNSWWSAEEHISSFLRDWQRLGRLPSKSGLKNIGSRLMQRDQSYYDRRSGVREASAVGSDGKIPLGGRGQANLDDLVDRLAKRLDKVSAHGEDAREAVRTLGYTSTTDRRFATFLEKRIRAEDTALHRSSLEACGWCLRDRKVVADFARVALARMREGGGTNIWTKSLANVLRFREDATHDLSSRDGHALCRALINLFAKERQSGKGLHIFRNACMSIVYLLRRRAYDDDFLDPESELAMTIKDEFRQAVRDSKAHRLPLMGGYVDLASEFQRLIDYIDRHGHGLPGMGVS